MSDSDLIYKGVRLFRVYHRNGEVINREIDVDEYIAARAHDDMLFIKEKEDE